MHKKIAQNATHWIRSHVIRLRFHDKITNMGLIARRYIVTNAFDGALTIFGVTLGAFLTGVTMPSVILGVGFSTSIALAVSGLWGAFLTESAERRKEIKEIEAHLMVNLDRTELHAAERTAVFVAAVINAVAPITASLLILLPFIAATYGLVSVQDAYFYAFFLSFAVFFLLGIFLGKISKDNIVVAGCKTLLAGITSAVLTWILTAGRVI